jgi:hypothetical protein
LVRDRVSSYAAWRTSFFSVSNSGTLAWRSGTAVVSQVTVFDRKGNRVGVAGPLPNVNAVKLLAVPDAPWLVARSSVTLLNPLCSEQSWMLISGTSLHIKPPARAAIEPDFAQFSQDDDDLAPAKPAADEEPAIDFHKLSDALTGDGSRPSVPEGSGTPWVAIALVASGAVAILVGAFKCSQ